MPDDNVGQKDDKVANSKEHVKKENVVRIDSVSAVGKDMNSPTQSIATPQSAEFNIEDDNERYAHTPKGKDRIGKLCGKEIHQLAIEHDEEVIGDDELQDGNAMTPQNDEIIIGDDETYFDTKK